MHQNRPDGIDLLATGVLGIVIIATVLVAYAPTQDAPTLWSRIWHDAGWPLILAIVSTFVAAFAGTWGAQTVAERIAARKELLAEIRSVNAALALCFSITNTFVTLKKQHVKGLVQEYETVQAALSVRGPEPEFHIVMDLKELSVPFSPVNELREIMLGKLSLSIKALIKLTPLIQSVQDLGETLGKRNKWIAWFENQELSQGLKVAKYLGLETGLGKIDARYPSYIQVIKEKTDDCIAFPTIISQSLKTYGEVLRKRYGSDAPKIISGDFQRSADYLPDLKNYKDWIDT